jgi:transposase
MTRDFGRCPKGERLHDRVPRNKGELITMIGALTVNGLSAVMTLEGATDADAFYTYVDQVLAPELRPGTLVVLDNLSAHKDERIRFRIEACGAKLVFLPPYSPELNPIECAWSKLKSLLKVAKARTRDSLDAAIGMAMQMISSDDACGWFNHCGYNAQPV